MFYFLAVKAHSLRSTPELLFRPSNMHGIHQMGIAEATAHAIGKCHESPLIFFCKTYYAFLTQTLKIVFAHMWCSAAVMSICPTSKRDCKCSNYFRTIVYFLCSEAELQSFVSAPVSVTKFNDGAEFPIEHSVWRAAQQLSGQLQFVTKAEYMEKGKTELAEKLVTFATDFKQN